MISSREATRFFLFKSGKKMPKGLICYCFNYTESDIEADILENRKSTIEVRIKAEKKAGACECATKNPSGK